MSSFIRVGGRRSGGHPFSARPASHRGTGGGCAWPAKRPPRRSAAVVSDRPAFSGTVGRRGDMSEGVAILSRRSGAGRERLGVFSRPTDADRDRRRGDLVNRARLVRAHGWDDYRAVWSTGEVVGVAVLLGDHDLLDEFDESLQTVW